MKLVWQRDTATVRDIYEALLQHRKIAYTTVMTVMKILESKGYLKKRRQDRAFVYRRRTPRTRSSAACSGNSSIAFSTVQRSRCSSISSKPVTFAKRSCRQLHA